MKKLLISILLLLGGCQRAKPTQPNYNFDGRIIKIITEMPSLYSDRMLKCLVIHIKFDIPLNLYYNYIIDVQDTNIKSHESLLTTLKIGSKIRIDTRKLFAWSNLPLDSSNNYRKIYADDIMEM